ncbi:MAG: hypothetical protein AUG09_06405 [Acidobacteria bacterium 13_1_20CM_2_68_7]|nr:MAG: hypothetical protein AUG09_06405 [Acidobacteria bacterium 13_1_20CM_2_68_7]
MDGRARSDVGERGRLARLRERFLGRRRSYVVDAAYQLRSAIIAVLGMASLLVFAAALFHLLSQENARLLARRAPVPAGGFAALHSVLYLLAVGLFFVAAVFAIEIVETHKTAGVIHKITRGLRELQAGRWAARVTLRRHDNFKEMEEAFNAATRALRDQLDDDLRGLQGIEGQVRLLAREFEAGNPEGALVMLRQVAAELQGLRERKRNLLESAPSIASERKEG